MRVSSRVNKYCEKTKIINVYLWGENPTNSKGSIGILYHFALQTFKWLMENYVPIFVWWDNNYINVFLTIEKELFFKKTFTLNLPI